MQTFQIATPRAFPKQVIEDVKFGFIFPEDVVDEFSHKSNIKIQTAKDKIMFLTNSIIL